MLHSFFLAKSLKASMYFTLTADLNLDLLHSTCSKDTSGSCIGHWTDPERR